MTDEQLAEIEKACAEATPGPWRAELGGYAASHPACAEDFSALFGAEERLVVEGDGGSIGKMTDGRFIAGARSWVPALVAEVKRLRRANENLTESMRLGEERWAIYQESVDETNRLLDEAGLHVGSQDLSTLVCQLIADADNGRTALRRGVAEAYEKAARAVEALGPISGRDGGLDGTSRANAEKAAAAIRALAKGEG